MVYYQANFPKRVSPDYRLFSGQKPVDSPDYREVRGLTTQGTAACQNALEHGLNRASSVVCIVKIELVP